MLTVRGTLKRPSLLHKDGSGLPACHGMPTITGVRLQGISRWTTNAEIDTSLLIGRTKRSANRSKRLVVADLLERRARDGVGTANKHRFCRDGPVAIPRPMRITTEPNAGNLADFPHLEFACAEPDRSLRCCGV